MGARKTYQQIIFLYPGQKNVITCEFPESDDVKKMRELGVARILQKSYSLNQLGESVQQELAA
jgi:hypothetical protein